MLVGKSDGLFPGQIKHTNEDTMLLNSRCHLSGEAFIHQCQGLR
uniref:Uncharacterized protein n=1 Tax=Anguilla anguilla TaxID=7936 RepID=A0A0E9SE72_ANGAN